ncbi:MAG: hypothetical protein ABIO72_01150 [Patescibacteria group bacterium]
MFWPVVIAVLILALAFGIFQVVPDLLDFGSWFPIVIISFLLLFAGAAAFMIYKLPSISALTGAKTQSNTKVITVPDVIVTD